LCTQADYRASQRKLGGVVLKFEADPTVHLFCLIGSGTNWFCSQVCKVSLLGWSHFSYW